ncbi:acyl carrier protein [Thermocatellispora tengchongensis]|uniref:Acyl carrier protein n=1 Tax=Thermocatellispora tengchongensis TaxID=1073253 RepID=A0A840P7N5_9ACTN|nr:acyl carrier protein [Thermocatellispora tengchongensis]MBB5132025.1 acyl carrier protein [Thermocatellispora tengchongensis]
MLRERLARMISEAGDGEISAAEILADGGSLTALGLTSLAALRLIDAIETELGVEVDIDADPEALESLDGLTAHVAGRLTRSPR